MATMQRMLFLLTIWSNWSVTRAGPAGPRAGAFTCEAGIFTAGEPATVTCHFHRDVNRTMHHVYVTRYSFDSTKDYIDVIDCFRKRTFELSCKVEPGYEYNQVISDTMTFRIPKVSSSFEGRYGCSLVPPEGINPNLCELHVKSGPPSMLTARPKPPHDTASEPTRHNSEGSKRPYIIGTGVAVGITVLLMISAAIYFCWFRSRLCFPCHKADTGSKATQRCKTDGTTGASSFTTEQVTDLLKDMGYRHRFIGEMMVHGRFAGQRKLERLLHEAYDHNGRECGPPTNAQELQTIICESDQFDLQEWLQGLPDDARNTLVTEGFDDIRVLRNATEKDIDGLKLKQGHKILVMAGVRTCQQQARRTTHVPVKGKRRTDTNFNSTRSEKTVLLPPVTEAGNVLCVHTTDESEAEDMV